MPGTIFITGATGNVGSVVMQELVKRGACVRAGVFNELDAARLPEGTDYVLFDFEDPATFDAALEDADRVFLMRPPHMSDGSAFEPFLSAMKTAEVEQVAFLSLMGVDKNPVVPHHAIEKRLKASGLEWTMVRPAFFMQNLSTTHLRDIVENHEIFVPAGKGKTSFIDVRDIGAVCAAVLDEDGHLGEACEISGPQALSYRECADIMTEVLGREIIYTEPSGRAFAKRMAERGYDKGLITVMRGIYLIAKVGLAGRVTNQTEQLLGRPPRSFREFVESNIELFSAEG